MKDGNESAQSQMRRGMLEFCTMLIIERERAYASEILAELKQADLIVVEGTLYPLLSRLRAAKLVDYEWRESKAGPPRKYYALSDRGKKDLAKLKETWKALIASINSLIA